MNAAGARDSWALFAARKRAPLPAEAEEGGDDEEEEDLDDEEDDGEYEDEEEEEELPEEIRRLLERKPMALEELLQEAGMEFGDPTLMQEDAVKDFRAGRTGGGPEDG